MCGAHLFFGRFQCERFKSDWIAGTFAINSKDENAQKASRVQSADGEYWEARWYVGVQLLRVLIEDFHDKPLALATVEACNVKVQRLCNVSFIGYVYWGGGEGVVGVMGEAEFSLPSLHSTSKPSDVWLIIEQLYGDSGLPAAIKWNTHGSFCWPTTLSAQHMIVP